MLVWVMMAIALWHFTVFMPDHFWGGIVGALLCAVAGSALVGFVISGFSIPGEEDTHLGQALIALPGTFFGLAFSYYYGLAQDRRAGVVRHQL
jgi:hypothetical protein